MAHLVRLHDWEPDEDGTVPEGVRNDDGTYLFREETVGQTPYESGYNGSHYKHEIEFRNMNQAIDEGSDYEADVGIPPC